MRMKVAVAIPWRKTKDRIFAKDSVVEWYERIFPNFDIKTFDQKKYINFNRAASRNLCVQECLDYDVVIINDADTIPEARSLKNAIEHCQYSGRVHLPYDKYYSLTDIGLQNFKDGISLNNCDKILVKDAVSGVLVLSPQTWEKHGGQDENFEQWGFEDSSWYIAHSTLLGKPVRHFGNVYSFPHNVHNKKGDQYYLNGKRAYLYELANNDYQKMHDLVFNKNFINEI